ncbi:MAG TPA: hypothetical protein VGF45_00740 [Polyangia bacterium]
MVAEAMTIDAVPCGTISTTVPANGMHSLRVEDLAISWVIRLAAIRGQREVHFEEFQLEVTAT